MQILNIHDFENAGLPWPENAEYIGRAGKGITGSKFCNPIHLRYDTPAERVKVLKAYKLHIWLMCLTRKITKAEILALDGKDLLCFCAPKLCHATVILELIDFVKNYETSFDYHIAKFNHENLKGYQDDKYYQKFL